MRTDDYTTTDVPSTSTSRHNMTQHQYMNFHHPHPSIFHVDQTISPYDLPRKRTQNMPKESLITDSIVERVALDWRGQEVRLNGSTSLQTVTDVLAAFPRLPADSVFVLYGRAHRLILPHPANPDQGTRWTPKPSGGGKLELVLARVDEPAQWVCPRYEVYPEQGKIGPDEPTSWLVADFNPTTILTGNNVMPATIADPETGEINEIPSSSPRFLITAFRMGFDLLGQLARAGRPDPRGPLQSSDLAGDRGRRRPRRPRPVGRVPAGRRPRVPAAAGRAVRPDHRAQEGDHPARDAPRPRVHSVPAHRPR